MSDSIRVLSAAAASSWTSSYSQAFSYADGIARYVTGIATLSSFGPSTGPANFDPSGTAFTALVARLNAAIAAANSPTNGAAPMPRAAALVQAALNDLTSAFGSGQPSPSPPDTTTPARIAVAEAAGAALSVWALTSAASLTFATSGTITRSTGSFVSDGFVAGMTIVVQGSAANDGTYAIKSVASSVLTLTSGPVANEGPAAGVSIVST